MAVNWAAPSLDARCAFHGNHRDTSWTAFRAVEAICTEVGIEKRAEQDQAKMNRSHSLLGKFCAIHLTPEVKAAEKVAIGTPSKAILGPATARMQ